MARKSRGPVYYPSTRQYIANLRNRRIVLLRDVERSGENDRLARERYDQYKTVLEAGLAERVAGFRQAVETIVREARELLDFLRREGLS
jgi:hypothetical protein